MYEISARMRPRETPAMAMRMTPKAVKIMTSVRTHPAGEYGAVERMQKLSVSGGRVEYSLDGDPYPEDGEEDDTGNVSTIEA